MRMARKAETTAAQTEKDPRWRAVVSHDRAADGAFYYSVRTTGVYCKPSCAARLARPDNVEFHRTAADAERAGFRPCKRCRPDQIGGHSGHHATVVARLCRWIENSEQAPTLEKMAAESGWSPYHLHRVFKAETGLTPKAYVAAHRSTRVREELRRRATVTDAIYGAGYNSGSRFYEHSRRVLGMSPAAYRSGGAGIDMRFAVGECTLGSILVAATDVGVCAILMGDHPEALVQDLQDRFPQAHLLGGDAAFERLVATVIGFVEAPQLGLDLPLDVRGTAFQQRVWNALMTIPAGTTASYAEIASRIGAPRSVRAVAGACAANPLAVVIPCHRVVRTDGGLSGYRWGIERKRELLRRESKGGPTAGRPAGRVRGSHFDR